jgi:hypothetical protein
MRLVAVTVLLLVAALFVWTLRSRRAPVVAQRTACCSAEPCFDCESVQALLAQTQSVRAFGRGFYKQAHVVRVGERAFVVKTPHNDSFAYVRERWASKNDGHVLSDADVAAHVASKFESECAQMKAWQRLEVPVAPHVHGGCFRPASAIVSVVEQLRTIADVTFDASVPLRARVLIAANLMRLVRAWDALEPFNHSRADTDVISSIKDYRVVDATALIYGDFDPKQFAIDAEWRPRLVDIDAREWVPYAPSRGNFASDVACASDSQCHDLIAQFGIDRRLEKGKRPLPHEFGCDAAAGRCRGLSGKTNAFAACAILIYPLLDTFYEYTRADTARWQATINTILARCTAQEPASRATALETEQAFRLLLGEEPRTPLPPLNLTAALSAAELDDRIGDIRKSIKKQRVSVVV